ncbi:unnamed protein product [Protopolystoma xenopodis]|uniref:Sulfatase N-terminal domain-containing protein n=1 Tax=Protopolystoma xenopodis TaxID=117903 RepID=A0A3S5BTX0_9PLAT|nr:unnamed protein product [Protopolystoma xenopodis]
MAKYKPKSIECNNSLVPPIYVGEKQWPKELLANKHCSITPFQWVNDFAVDVNETQSKSFHFDATGSLNEDNLFTSFNKLPNWLADFYMVVCSDSNTSNMTFKFYYLTIYMNASRIAQINAVRKTHRSDQPNFYLLGIDSVSHAAFEYVMPETNNFIKNVMNSTIFNLYNVVADGTTSNLLALLTGRIEEEFHETRRGYANSDTVDEFNWIWQELEKKLGYASLYSEDMPSFGTFQYRLLGFRNIPTTHYLRPFLLKAKEYNWACLGRDLEHKILLYWTEVFVEKYSKYVGLSRIPWFAFTFLSEISHETNPSIKVYMDNDVANNLRNLYNRKLSVEGLDNTILLLFADHGSRFSRYKGGIQVCILWLNIPQCFAY